VAAQTLELILDKEGHDLGQAHGFFLIIGKAGDALALDERLSLIGRLEQNTRAMTDGGDRFAGIVEILDQGDRVLVIGQIPHRAVATGIEDRVVVGRLDVGKLDAVGQHLLGRRIFLETQHRVGLIVGIVASGIDRGMATLGRRHGDLCTGIRERIVGGGELFKPETGRLAGISKHIVRSQNQQDLHCQSPFIGANP
jgi:hypothetical protein